MANNRSRPPQILVGSEPVSESGGTGKQGSSGGAVPCDHAHENGCPGEGSAEGRARWEWFLRNVEAGNLEKLCQVEVVALFLLSLVFLLLKAWLEAAGNVDDEEARVAAGYRTAVRVLVTVGSGSTCLCTLPVQALFLASLPSQLRLHLLRRQWVINLAMLPLFLVQFALLILYVVPTLPHIIAAIGSTAAAERTYPYGRSRTHTVAFLAFVLSRAPLTYCLFFRAKGQAQVAALRWSTPEPALPNPTDDPSPRPGLTPTTARRTVPHDAPDDAASEVPLSIQPDALRFLQSSRSRWLEVGEVRDVGEQPFHAPVQSSAPSENGREEVGMAVAEEAEAEAEAGAYQGWHARVLGRELEAMTSYDLSTVLTSVTRRMFSHPLLAGGAFFLVACNSATLVSTAFVQASLLEAFAGGPVADWRGYIAPLISLVVCRYAEAGLKSVVMLLFSVLAEAVKRDIHVSLFRNVSTCDTVFRAFSDGDMAKRFSGDTDAVAIFLTSEFAWSILATFTTLVAGTVGMLRLDAPFALVFLAIAPSGLLLASDFATDALDEAAEREARLGDVFVNYCTLRRMLELYEAGRTALATAIPSITATWRANRRAGIRNNQAYALTILMQRTFEVVAIAYAAVTFSMAPNPVQLLTAFLQVLTEVVYLLDEMSEGRRATSEVAPHLHRIDEATACLPSDLASAKMSKRKGGDSTRGAGDEGVAAAVPNFLGEGGIQFVGVSFSYSAELEPVIRRMSCHIPARRFTCLVGESGSGKSTALGLLTREIQEQRGKVLVDGQRLSEFDCAAVRSQMAVVQQQVMIMDGTVAENIRLGKEDASDEEVRRAGELAECHTFVQGLPDGYNTQLSAGGTGAAGCHKLSGGQLQRICLARALCRQPGILLLDEATSALDQATEASIIETIRKIADAGTTVVSVTHRLHTTMCADKVIVLGDGQVLESGEPHTLLACPNATFSQLVANAPIQGEDTISSLRISSPSVMPQLGRVRSIGW